MYFTVIGNDNRMNYVAQQLYSLGCEVSREFNNKVYNKIVIMPPVVNEEHASGILPYIDTISKIYVGTVSEGFNKIIKEYPVKIYEYLKWDYVIEENANLTALGIIKEAISYKASLSNSNILVTGYGFCGKALASALKNENANIYVAVRNHKLKDIINNAGYVYCNIKDVKYNLACNLDYIFNSVPALVITSDIIDKLKEQTMIFDIASKPGGVDYLYCKQKNIFAIQSLGIPGRDYPKEAGYLIANACFNHCCSLM